MVLGEVSSLFVKIRIKCDINKKDDVWIAHEFFFYQRS